MGFSATQVFLLRMVDRKATIDNQLQHFTLQKNSLARDMNKITQEYQDALSSKTLQWSPNSGITTVDLNYNTLMRPNTYNAQSPILITTSDGKVVLDSKYKEYAELLDKNGGKWSGDTRTEILSKLTGISAQDIAFADSASSTKDSASTAYSKAQDRYDEWKAKETSTTGAGTKYESADGLAKKLGKTSSGIDLSSYYSSSNKKCPIKSSGDINSIVNTIKNSLGKYFVDDELLNLKDKTAFFNACDTIGNTCASKLKDDDENADRELYGITGEYGNWSLDFKTFFNYILGAYKSNGGKTSSSNTTGDTTYALRDTESASWKKWYTELQTRKAACDSTKSEYTSSTTISGQVLTAAQENQIKFYDQLFTAIAKNGWEYDISAENADYLNQKLQNNDYYLTTMTKNDCFDSSQDESNENFKYFYDTNIAENCNNIFKVNDSKKTELAQVKYEYDKRLINNKEIKIDERMKKFETERAAIVKMIESDEKIIKDNADRTFKLWA